MVLGISAAVGTSAEAVQYPQSALVSETPASWTPNIMDDGARVNAVVQIGNTMIIGGDFTNVRAAGSSVSVTRPRILAFNATNGALSTTFLPALDGTVTSLLPAADGQSVYVGGMFNNVNGVRSQSLARINLSNGQLTQGFTAPVMDGRVKDLKLSGGRLWVAGTFAKVAGHSQAALTTLNPTSGAYDGYMGVQISGVHNGDVTQVMKMDITPDGSRLVGIGNFTTVGGSRHEQAMMLDLTGPSAAVADWQTTLYEGTCSSSFNSYMRDLDISPDGTYFAISTTGAYGGSTGPCDQVSRWNFDATGSGLTPAWTNYTGGDTTYAVAITATAVYTGGHFRWQNNAFAGDRPGPGAISRPGITALDPANGLPFSWNPTRALGVGVFDMLATSAGLWVGSDTNEIDGFARYKIAFLPLAGGKTVPRPTAGSLPDDVYLAGRTDATDSSNVLYRVNAGGPALLSTDSGPDWAVDTSAAPDPHQSGSSNAADWGSAVASVDPSVPAGVPVGLFTTERWGSTAGNEMAWHFKVAAGTTVQVHLFFANRCGCTATVGQRKFDVAIDGVTKLASYDIVGDVGNGVGVMKSFDVVSDGVVDISFGHVVENPLVNGIELVAPNGAPQVQPSPVIYRLNAAGSTVASLDNGPDWASDQGTVPGVQVSGGNTAIYGGGSVSLAPSVPASTPPSIFDSERWGPQTWTLDVPSGENVHVNLYFANRYGGTSTAGQRVFNVAVNGSVVLTNYDIVADVGDQTGTMKSFATTGDANGHVTIDLSAVVENPLINGVEVVDDDPLPPPPPPPAPVDPDELQVRHYDGSTVGPSSVLGGTGIAWGSVRGATMLNGVLYYTYADGGFYSRTFDGSTFGPAKAVNTSDLLVPLSDWHSDAQSMTGMFFADGRLYFTEFGSSNLYYRYFTPESGVVGAVRFVASGNVAGIDWSAVSGMFLSGDKLYYATKADGVLHRADFVGGAAVAGTSVPVSGPGIDAKSWRTRALFLYSSATGVPANQSPTAIETVNCTNLTCTASSAGSSDPDGTIVSYAWNFGDGHTATTPTASNTYTTGGTYTVTLTVTDNNGATDTATKQVTVSAANALPVASFTASCTLLACSFDGSKSADPDGTIASYAWDFGDGHTATTASPSNTYSAAGSYNVKLTVTDNRSGTGSTTQQVTVSNSVANIAFRAKATSNVNSTSVSVTVPPSVQAGDALLLFFSGNTAGGTVTGPTGVSGWTSLGTALTGSNGTWIWQKLAAPADLGKTITVQFGATTKLDLQLLAYSGVGTAAPVATFGSDATAVLSHPSPNGATVTEAGSWVLNYWSDKSSTTTDWTAPPGLTVRDESIGAGGGRISSLLADSAAAAPLGPVAVTSATTDAASRATEVTIVLRPAG